MLLNQTNLQIAIDQLNKISALLRLLQTGSYLDPVTRTLVTFDPTNPLDATTSKIVTEIKSFVSQAITALQAI